MSDVWLNTPPGTRVRGSWTNERAASDHVTDDQPMRIAGQQVNTLPAALLLGDTVGHQSTCISSGRGAHTSTS